MQDIRLLRSPEQAARDRAEELAMKQAAASAADKALSHFPSPTAPPLASKRNANEASTSIIATGMSRCTACGLIYEADDATSKCFYHPGNRNARGGRSGWSCCGNLEENPRGCCGPAVHIPCALTMQAMRQAARAAPAPPSLLPRAPALDPSFARMRENEAAAPAEEAETGRSAEAEEPVMGTYQVCAGESLGVIALRHGMSKEELRRLNKLLTPEVYPGQQLMVTNPRVLSDEEASAKEERRKERTVARKAKCERAEATYYLDVAGGDVGRALALHAEDSAWEEAVQQSARQSAQETAEKMALASAARLSQRVPRSQGQTCEAPLSLQQPRARCGDKISGEAEGGAGRATLPRSVREFRCRDVPSIARGPVHGQAGLRSVAFAFCLKLNFFDLNVQCNVVYHDTRSLRLCVQKAERTASA